RSAVAKKALAVPTGPLAEGLGEFALLFGVPSVWHVYQTAYLLADGGHHARRAMANQIAAPAWEEIEVAIALGVPHAGSFAAHQRNRVARVVADDKLLEQVDGLLRGHEAGSIPCPCPIAIGQGHGKGHGLIAQHDFGTHATFRENLEKKRMPE